MKNCFGNDVKFQDRVLEETLRSYVGTMSGVVCSGANGLSGLVSDWETR